MWYLQTLAVNPPTGDEAQLLPVAIVMGVAVIAIVLLVIFMGKNKE